MHDLLHLKRWERGGEKSKSKIQAGLLQDQRSEQTLLVCSRKLPVRERLPPSGCGEQRRFVETRRVLMMLLEN